MKKFLLVAVLLLSAMMVTVPMVSAQEEVVTGEVVSISEAQSSIVVKYVANAELETYQTETFYLDGATKIMKGEGALMVSDLKVGDKVTINCTKNEAGEKVAASITL